MKTIAFFHGDNCVNCEALKKPLRAYCKKKGYDIIDFHFNDSMRRFRDYRVSGIPTVMEFEKGQEVEGTRQVGNIDITKY